MFIAKNNDLIILANNNREELEQGLLFMQYTDIEETDINYILHNGQYLTEEEIAQQEKERIAQLNMTRGDFFEGLILSIGKDEDDILALIDVIELTETERKIYKSRVKNALDFYRGYPVIDVLCGYLGLTTEQMTQFFETKDWKCLIPVVEEPEEPVEEPVEEENADSTDIQI